MVGCEAPSGYLGLDVSLGIDCDDANPSIHLDLVELCNGYDDNCDDLVGDGASSDAGTWYADAAPLAVRRMDSSSAHGPSFTMDGLYVVAVRQGEAEPRIWALHRMEGVSRRRDVRVEIPRRYHPADLLGHGYGPFVGSAGRTDIRIPGEEARWVLESPLPAQVGEPELLADGSYRVVLGIGPNPGLWIWARANGVEIEVDENPH